MNELSVSTLNTVIIVFMELMLTRVWFARSGWDARQTWVPDVGPGVFREGSTWWRWAAQTSPAAFTTGTPLKHATPRNIHVAVTRARRFADMTRFYSCQQFITSLSHVFIRSTFAALTSAGRGPSGARSRSFSFYFQSWLMLMDAECCGLMLWISPPSFSTQGNLYSRLTCHGGWLTSAHGASTCC